MKRTFHRLLRRAALALAAAGLAAWASAPAQVPGETRSGWLNVVWGTRGAHNELAHVGLFLVDEHGDATELRATEGELAPFGGVLGLNGRRLTVTGDLSTARAPGATPTLRVRSITPRQGPAAAVLAGVATGPKAYLILVCRFPDQPPEPTDAATLARWLGSAYPGLDHFWRENSENRLSIVASFAGPYTLPRPTAAYQAATGNADLGPLMQDCTRAADADVDFTRYSGILMQFNAPLWNVSWGGTWAITLDGVTRNWPTTWMASWASQSTYAHETGHSLGLPHSSGPYGQVYDSRWDVMSGGGSSDPASGTRVAPHTIAFHKELLGWIPAERRFVARPGATVTLDLARGALPGAAGYQVARVPVGTGGTYLTFEARRYAGYDARGRLPGEGVVIHLVDPRASVPARVVDVDGNDNVNDEGAIWVPGEIFTSVPMAVSMRVLSATPDGYRVEISTTGSIAVATDSVLPGGTVGADYAGTLSATGVSAAASWVVASGAPPPGVSLAADGRLAGVPLAAGVFRFVARVSDGNGFAIREMRMDVGRPQVPRAAVLGAVLGSGSLAPAEQRYLDILGNGNGRMDVGDLRAYLQEQGLPVGG